MKKSLIALAFGTLALGIAEFTMMGILPYVASDFGISIAKAGHFISAYALGVCCGAPVLILARKRPLKQILMALVTLIIVGNLCASLAPNYWILMLGRFVSGLPHGAYFGVASIVASKLADKGKSSEAVSIMIAGMTVANLFGVPLGTSLSHMLSWRVTFLLVAFWGVIVLYYIGRWVPFVEGLQDTGFKGQFRFLRKPAPWILLGATALGNGGVFCWYSYISPLLTHVSGFSDSSISALMVLAGFGMVAGNLISGRMSDRYTPGRVTMFVQAGICLTLLAIFFLASNPWMSVLLMILCTAGLFAVSSPEQLLIIRVAPGGEMLGGACVQMAFNLGNAVGAYAGGLVVTHDYRYTALVGIPFALIGFILAFIFYKRYQMKYEV
ncbi:MFS transporter AraJ [Parabacteroides sp. AD58]|uniref:MFS transporter AraJ n=1 Tax=Parabacteroides absconsus TaxID=2951805 RepID=A0ABZ2IQR7_9BACT|nr:MFS transporter AraJ [Parabacteroides sp. AD58]MCM6901883.1 MFS transporter AraJ [Parabacteroides sp. AD58]